MTMPRLDPVMDPLAQYLRQQNDLSLTPVQRTGQRTGQRPGRQEQDLATGSPGWRQRRDYLEALEKMLASQRLRDGSELPLFDRERSMLPAMEIRADAPQAFEAGVARSMSPALERGAPPAVTARVPGLGESLADVGKMTGGALYDSGASLVEGGLQALGELPTPQAFLTGSGDPMFPNARPAAAEVRRSREAMREATAPETGLGKAAQLPASMVAYGLPFAATAGTGAPILNSAALTGMQSQAQDASLAGALGVENPMLRGALDVGADMAFSLAGPVFRGAEAAGLRGAGREVGRELGQETLRGLQGLQGMAREGRLAPGLSTMDVGPDSRSTREPHQLVTMPTITQEVRSVGSDGFVEVPDDFVPNPALERQHLDQLTAKVEPILQSVGAPVIARTEGQGLFGGSVSPNQVAQMPVDVSDDAVRTAAAVRGLSYGQTQQLWFRPLQTPGENTTVGLVLTGMDGAPLPQATIDEVLDLARADDALGKYGGATRFGDHLLFLNLKHYTQMDDARFMDVIQRVVASSSSASDIDAYTSHFLAEELNGAPAYLRAIGNNPDALRAAHAALTGAADEYVAYARAVGGEAGADRTRAFIDTRLSDLDELIKQLENPPPPGRRGGKSVVEVASVANQIFPPIADAMPEEQIGEMVERLGWMSDDMVARERIPAEMARDWYGGASKIQRALARIAHPSLADDNKYQLYVIANSIMSNGEQVGVEARTGMDVWTQYERTGRFSTMNPRDPSYATAYATRGSKRGMEGARAIGMMGDEFRASQRTLNHELALQRLDALVQAYGEKGALEVMRGTVPYKIKGSTEQRPAMVELFGPKIGQYAMDKLGIPTDSGSTIDLWMARLYYVLRGDNGNLTVDKNGNYKLDDTVTPEMRRTMQAVLKAYAQQRGMPNSSAQAIAWYAVKDIFGEFGANEKRDAYATLGSATADALTKPGKKFGTPIRQGSNVQQGTAGWNDRKLADFTARIDRKGSIKPTAGAFAGRVFGLAPLGLAPFAGGEPFPVLEEERPRGRGIEPLGRR